MTMILALDLGKFKTVCCFFNSDDGEVRSCRAKPLHGPATR